MKKRSKKTLIKHSSFFLILIITAMIVLGIGYAQVANVDLNVSGTATLETSEGIIISDISYLSGYNSDPSIQVFNNPRLSIMQSTVTLNNDFASHITYRVTFYNATDYVGVYDQAIYSQELGYDNPEIVFDVTGLRQGDRIEPGQTRELTITFKYNSSLTSISNNVLNSMINFKWNMIKPVAQIGSTKYNTLQEAVNAANYNGNLVEIKLLRDTQERVIINSGQNVKIDLDGNTVTNNGNYPVFEVRGQAYLYNGTITTDATQAAITMKPNGNLVADSLRVEATGERQALYNDNADALIKGDSYFSNVTARACVHNVNGGRLTIESGRFESGTNSAVYNQNGTLVVGVQDGVAHHNSPVMIGATYGIQSNSAYKFYDGIAKGITNGVNNVNYVSEGMEEGCELVTKKEIVGIHTYKVHYPAIAALVTFNANGGSSEEKTRKTEKDAEIGSLPSAYRTGYLFDGWYTAKTGGVQVDADYVVSSDVTFWAHWIKSERVVESNGVVYDTIQQAINAAPDNTPTTITMLKDTTESIKVNANKNIILELDEHTLANSGANPTITNNGSLTVTGGLLTSDDRHAAINQEAGTLNVYANITTTSDRQAIYITGGTVNIYADSYLVSSAIEITSNTTTLRSTVQCMQNCTLNIFGGTIIGLKQQAITNLGNMTIGTQDGNVSQEEPYIRGESSGIVNQGTFNFYDGIVYGRTVAVDGTVTDSETPLEDGTERIDNKTYYSKYNS